MLVTQGLVRIATTVRMKYVSLIFGQHYIWAAVKESPAQALVSTYWAVCRKVRRPTNSLIHDMWRHLTTLARSLLLLFITPRGCNFEIARIAIPQCPIIKAWNKCFPTTLQPLATGDHCLYLGLRWRWKSNLPSVLCTQIRWTEALIVRPAW